MTTQLKDHRYDFPLEKLGEKKRRAAKVELTDSGFFKIYYPKEVVEMFGLQQTDHSYGSTIREAVNVFERQIEKYKNTIQAGKREKVIVVRYLYNKPYDQGFGGTYQLQRGDHGHWRDDAGRYGLALDFEVMWRIGDSLYDVPIDDDGSIFGPPHHRYRYPIADRAYHVLDWTEEREQFLFNMTGTLEGLIRRLNSFFGDDLAANMTKAIASGGGLNALPAPQSAE